VRALTLQHGRLAVSSVSEPSPSRTQLLTRPLACGICGSDIHAAASGLALKELRQEVEASAPHSPLRGPLIDPADQVMLGHEFSAEVLAIGGDVEDFSIGDVVVSRPRVFDADGVKHTVGFSAVMPGGFGELMALDAAEALRVADWVDPHHAALTEPVAVALHALNRIQLRPGQPVIVVGCGPVGLALITVLVARDHHPLIAAETDDGRRRWAENVGADQVIDPRADSAGAVAMGLSNIAPVVFEAVGVPGVLDAVILDAPADSHVVVVGACLDVDAWRPMLALGRELTLTFALGYSAQEFADSLRLITSGLSVAELVTNKVTLDEAVATFDQLRRPEHTNTQVKVLVSP